MKRVNKGEKYWFIRTNDYGYLIVDSIIETNSFTDQSRHQNNNCFHTKEQADLALDKILAVLKGADVIKIPSEEEISEKSNSSAHEMDIDDGETPNSGLYWRGWGDAVLWLKSKIVK